jgi:hypothetical protein
MISVKRAAAEQPAIEWFAAAEFLRADSATIGRQSSTEPLFHVFRLDDDDPSA